MNDPSESEPAAPPAFEPPAAPRPPLLSDEPVSPPEAAVPHPVSVVTLYLIAVFLGAALAAPRFYATAQYLADGSHNPSIRHLAEQPFHRYVSRSLILLALVGLPVFLKALRIPSRRALGLRFRANDLLEAAQGSAWGFFALGASLVLGISFGAREWHLDHTPYEIVRHCRNTIFVALLVATIEEILFRGALFGSLRRQYRFWPAALISSGFYALVHFFQQPSGPDVVEWYSGLTTLGQMLRGFADWQTLFPGFLNLGLIGVILAMGFERTGSLLFSIAFHASLIFWVKSVGFVSQSANAGNSWIWGGNKLVDGWASGVILLAIFAILRTALPRISTDQDE